MANSDPQQSDESAGDDPAANEPAANEPAMNENPRSLESSTVPEVHDAVAPQDGETVDQDGETVDWNGETEDQDGETVDASEAENDRGFKANFELDEPARQFESSEPAREVMQDGPSEDTEYRDEEANQDATVVIEPLVRHPRNDAPQGIRRADPQGLDLVDAMAGRASAFGFGDGFLETAWRALDSSYRGDGSSYQPEPGDSPELLAAFVDVVGDQGGCNVAAVQAAASPAEAIEWAIAAVRTSDRYRTLTLAGSDHGCTGVGRTAGGLVALQNGYGPLVAGFTHVRPDDPDSLAAAVDDQTTAVLVSPMATHDGGRPISADLLIAARQICDSHDLSLIIDQTQVTFGAGGFGLAHRSIADVNADMVLCSAGLFGGLSGAIIAVSDRWSEPSVPRFPLQESVAIAALTAIADQDLIDSGKDRSAQLAVELAERVAQYDFVRDLHLLGPCIGLETDVAARSLVAQAAEDGLRIEGAGETSIRMQLPLMVSDSDWSELLARLDHTLAAVRDRMAVPV